MKTTVRTVAHWLKKFCTRSAIDGPPATGTRIAWWSCCESAVSASRMSLLVCCTALRVTGEVSADSPATSPLHPQDLVQGGTADLELLGGRPPRPDPPPPPLAPPHPGVAVP